jgi:anaerobic magnesium-protoporphyrin IX monomethyl ester cyclase
MESDILLINLWNSLKYFGNFVPHENLGLAYIMAYMKKKGFDCDLYDPTYDDLTRISNDLSTMNKKYKLIGVSLHDNNYKMLGKIIPIMRKCFPDSHIALGGLFATFHAEKLLSDEFHVDSIIQGEGEESFYLLYKAILTGGDKWKQCQSICFNEEGKFRRNTMGQRLNFAEVGYPDRVFVDRYHLPKIHVNATRGCNKNCSFCSAVRFTKMLGGDRITCRTAEDIANEVIDIYNKYYPFRKLEFVDDNFLANDTCKDRAKEFAKVLIDKKLKIPFRIDACVEDIEYELFSLLKQAGLVEVLIGVESFSDRILKIYNKGITSSQILKAVDILNDLKIHTRLGWIMFSPYINLKDLRINISFLSDVKLFWYFTDLIGSLRLQHGTPMLEKVKNDNLIIEAFPYPGYQYQDKKIEEYYKLLMTDNFKKMILTAHSLTYKLWQHTEIEEYKSYIELRTIFTQYMFDLLDIVDCSSEVDLELKNKLEKTFIVKVVSKLGIFNKIKYVDDVELTNRYVNNMGSSVQNA